MDNIQRLEEQAERMEMVQGRKEDYDQSVKADKGKPQLTLVPRQVIYDIARVREYGLLKYGKRENWREVEKERYRDAAFRHFLLYLDNPTGLDEESGLPHLSHLACNIAFLCELERGNERMSQELLKEQKRNARLLQMVKDEREKIAGYKQVGKVHGAYIAILLRKLNATKENPVVIRADEIADALEHSEARAFPSDNGAWSMYWEDVSEK